MAPMFSEYRELDTLRKALVEDFIRLRDGQIELEDSFGSRIDKLEAVNSGTGLDVAAAHRVQLEERISKLEFVDVAAHRVELLERIDKLEKVNSGTGLSVAEIVKKIDKLEESRIVIGGVTQQDFRDLEQSVEEFKESLQELSDEMSNFDFHDMEAGVMRIDDVVTAVTKIHDAIERAGTEVSGATRYL
jgi:predicted  nucleic acid-binding Zn-ribbon protein